MAERSDIKGGKVKSITFDNQPSFVIARDVPLQIPGYGECQVSAAYGGMAYLIIDPRKLGLDLSSFCLNVSPDWSSLTLHQHQRTGPNSYVWAR